MDPAGASGYDERATALAVALTELDDEIRGALAGAGGRGFIAYHDSWRYFAERYGLEQVGSIESVAGDEPTAAELAELIGGARAHAVHAVIMEPQLGQRIARTVAIELGAKLEMADPLGDPTDPARASYVETMRFNAAAFARALGGAAS
jgi:ABC-type Zn uptake system ZnuABC Zn-binding protein ZnuA